MVFFFFYYFQQHKFVPRSTVLQLKAFKCTSFVLRQVPHGNRLPSYCDAHQNVNIVVHVLRNISLRFGCSADRGRRVYETLWNIAFGTHTRVRNNTRLLSSDSCYDRRVAYDCNMCIVRDDETRAAVGIDNSSDLVPRIEKTIIMKKKM